MTEEELEGLRVHFKDEPQVLALYVEIIGEIEVEKGLNIHPLVERITRLTIIIERLLNDKAMGF